MKWGMTVTMDEDATKNDIQRGLDGLPKVDLSAVMQQNGHDFAGWATIWAESGSNVDDSEFYKQALEGVSLVASTTRVPEPDEDIEAHRPVLRYFNTWIESHFRRLQREFFDVCSRSITEVKRGFGAPEDRRRIQYRLYEKGGTEPGQYYRVGRPERTFTGPATTCGFLLYTPELYEGGPARISSFGICGKGTVIWNSLLRARYWEKVGVVLESSTKCLVMYEFPMEGTQLPMQTFSDLPVCTPVIDFPGKGVSGN